MTSSTIGVYVVVGGEVTKHSGKVLYEWGGEGLTTEPTNIPAGTAEALPGGGGKTKKPLNTWKLKGTPLSYIGTLSRGWGFRVSQKKTKGGNLDGIGWGGWSKPFGRKNTGRKKKFELNTFFYQGKR